MDHGYSQRQLAALVGVSRHLVVRIEGGEMTTLGTLGRLAAELKVDSLEELLRDDENCENTEEVDDIHDRA